MKILRQFCTILIILLMGEFINKFFGIPIPGNVLGLIILLVGLSVGIIKIEMVDQITKFLLDHLAFFFVPAGVGLITSLDVIGAQWFAILCVTIISTAIVIATTGLTVQLLKGRRV